ncbi:bacterioferritin [Thioalkalivibrio denitrificans]|uniref:Bacterioferritin n=1 Tax=Thioalkalivibrio denitrificans TaxID=108003 RepID=A0A1V3NJB6_9GAMM|nr:ferritin-like domain-containing protein [Thioalkalivibrio denitrificans]OOG24942.1 bacterioferritin [Thioalkalivibrio denitrificans]
MADSRIIGFLGRAISHEFSAAQQYLAQARLTALWGLESESAGFRKDADEEMGHADMLLTRMLFHGATPGGTHLAPVRLGRSLADLLLHDRELELDAVRLYEEAMTYCRRRRAEDDAQLFERILNDELEHVREIDARLAAMDNRSRSRG